MNRNLLAFQGDQLGRLILWQAIENIHGFGFARRLGETTARNAEYYEGESAQGIGLPLDAGQYITSANRIIDRARNRLPKVSGWSAARRDYGSVLGNLAQGGLWR